jgi:hypothetical protein
MRTRSASRLSPAPRSEVGAPASTSGLRLCAPHRATRRHVLQRPALSTLLAEGFSSAGRGVRTHLSRILYGLRRGVDALTRRHVRQALGWCAWSALRLPLLVVDPLLSVGGRLVSGLQTRLGLEPLGQRLGPRQRLVLRELFGDSLDAERICLKTGRLGLWSLLGRPFVLGNTLYAPGEVPLSSPQFVRALGHVWHAQHEGRDPLGETLAAGWFAEAEDWTGALSAGRTWSQLDPQQRLCLLEAVHERARPVPGQQAALEQMRAGRGARA